jgi:hypothetical protein
MGLSPVALYEAIYEDVRQSVRGFENFSHIPFPDCTYKQFASSYLLSSVVRKWIPDDTRSADRAAYNAFTSANNRCKDWYFQPEWEVDSLVFGEIRKTLDDFFHPGGEPLVGSYFDLLRSGRPGPGVNVGSYGTSFYTKYMASPLTTTSTYLYEEYKRYSEWIPFLSDAECLRYEKFGSPQITGSSRCSFVPKTSKASRMICIEPSLNMFYQLGLAAILTDRLRSYFGIDLATQPSVNHRLAQEGSKYGNYATIDLSSASDSISLRLCESILPKWVFDLLVSLRSRSARVGSEDVPLFMMSTMGNGFTFPLQTIIFSAVTQAIDLVYSRSRLSWSVYGDDIIASSSYCRPLIRFLKLLNFSVNPEKTFIEGPFRESCGSDWFYGQPVRPVFVKKLTLPYDFLLTINQLNEWTAYTGIPLWNTVQLLLTHLEPKFHNLVPFESALDSGIRVPSALLKPRFDRNLSFVYMTWDQKPVRISVWDGGIRYPGRLNKKSWYNPPGLYCSFLFGELVTYTISVRHDRKMYRRKLRCTPNWDYISADSRSNGMRLSWQQWETAVTINLVKS